MRFSEQIDQTAAALPGGADGLLESIVLQWCIVVTICNAICYSLHITVIAHRSIVHRESDALKNFPSSAGQAFLISFRYSNAIMWCLRLGVSSVPPVSDPAAPQNRDGRADGRSVLGHDHSQLGVNAPDAPCDVNDTSPRHGSQA